MNTDCKVYSTYKNDFGSTLVLTVWEDKYNYEHKFTDELEDEGTKISTMDMLSKVEGLKKAGLERI